MKKIICVLLILSTSLSNATIHKKNEFYVDIELDKKHLLIDCSEDKKENWAMLGFHLLDRDIYYFFFSRRPQTIKQCRKDKTEYLKILSKGQAVRLVGVGGNGDEELSDKERKMSQAPFSKAKKIYASFFVSLTSNGKCKGYFSDDCELDKYLPPSLRTK